MNKYTDQEFTYQQTPVSYDGIAKASLKGNTVAWNQLEKNDASTNTSTGVTFTNNGDGSWTVTGTPTGFVAKYVSNAGFNAIIGHKYLFFGRPYISDSTVSAQVSIRPVINGQAQSTLRDYGNGTVIEATTTDPVRSQILISVELSSSLNLVFHPMIIDLTMLGMDDVTDKASFQKYFDLPYYSYNQGTLLNFNGTGLKITGKNLINIAEFVQRSGYTNLSVSQENNIIAISGYSAGGRFACFNVPLIVGKQYTIKLTARSNVTGVSFIQTSEKPTSWIGNGTSIGINAPVTFTASQSWLQVVIELSADNATVTNLQLELGSVASDYEPYKESSLSLPISQYFPTGMKSAGTVYDELTPTKATTKTKTITFDGTESWAIHGSIASWFYVDGYMTDAKFSNTSAPLENTNTGGYEAVGYTYAGTLSNMQFTFNPTSGISSGSRLIFKNTLYTTVDQWINYLQSNPLTICYELATPTEQDINADLFYKFYGDGTEEILPTNGSTPTTSAFLGDIEYYTQFDSEVPYRKFWMVNSKGDRWNLTEHEVRSFMNNPQGFGFAKTISTTRYGNAQVLTDVTDNFPSPSGEVLFYDSHNSTRYEQYNEFVKFLSYEPVTLYYKLPFSFYSQIPNVYTLECVVGTLTKTESKTDNIMTCPITFNALSYYKGDEVNINGTGTSYTIQNDGDFPVGFEITVEGSLMNPYVLLSQNDELYGEAKFDDTTAFSSLYLNSNDGEQSVILQQSGSVLPNPLSYQDLSISNGSIYVTFVKLARGISELEIGSESGSITSVEIKYQPIYRSV